MSSFSSGAKVTLVSQWFRLGIQLAGFIVLSRLLTPDDFGIVAMVAVIVAFAALVSDFGLSLAGLQASSLSEQQKSNLFWMNSIAGLAGTILVAASGPVLALFYDEPRVVGLALALSVGLLLAGITAQFRVEVNRHRRFKVLAIQDVVSSLGGLIAATVAAVVGLGYWSLAVQTLTQTVILLLMAVFQAHWIPGLPRRNAGTRHFLRFGSDSFAMQLVNFASRSVDVMAIGRVSGPDALGIYSRSSQLVSLTIQQLVSPLTRAVLPGLSAQQETADFHRTLIRLQRIIVYVLAGLLSLLATTSAPLVTLALGSDWSGMAPVIQVLALGALFQGLGYVYYWAFLAIAKTRMLLISELPGRAVMILGSVVCAQFGIVAVAGAVTLGQIVIWACSSLLFAPKIGVNSSGLNRIALRPVIIFGLAFMIGLTCQAFLASTEANLITTLILTAVLWTVAPAVSLLSGTVRADLRSITREITGLAK